MEPQCLKRSQSFRWSHDAYSSIEMPKSRVFPERHDCRFDAVLVTSDVFVHSMCESLSIIPRETVVENVLEKHEIF